MPQLTTLAHIKKLEERYPFNEEELEIIVRCHDFVKDLENHGDFVVTLAIASPYSHFFLPGNEMRDRVNWIEDHVLPMGFSSRFRCAIATDAFVDYANQHQDKALERFIEGIADTGRRGNKEALKVVYNILDEDATEEKLIELCVSLAVASEALVTPNLDKEATMAQLKKANVTVKELSRSLKDYCGESGLTKRSFIDWAEETCPMLSAPMFTFAHNLLFHGHAFPVARIPYSAPKLGDSSFIFSADGSPMMLSLSFVHNSFCGKWQRLYCSENDGRCFNRLDWSLLGYTGPTIVVIRTTEKAVLGAFTSTPWKEGIGFYGDTEGFVFQLDPKLAVYRPRGEEKNFMFLHSASKSTTLTGATANIPYGMGFGGTLEKPRLFIPESLEQCSAGFLDTTYAAGELLPDDALEKFEIEALEVWAVGGDALIQTALRDQVNYRAIQDVVVKNAQSIHDKTAFVSDMQTGLIPNNLYSHRDQARGRHEFVVDDTHGGYKIDS